MKWMALFFAIPCATACFSVNAQVLGDQEKRRTHVPFVRATTDCIAQNAPLHLNFRSSVLSNNLLPVLQDIARTKCRDVSVDMVVAHNRIYGGGGMEFFYGPYMRDLERAVRNRIKPRIDSVLAEEARLTEVRRAEAEKAAALRAEQIQTAESVTAAVRTRAYACVRREAGTMILTSERAEVVARAAAVFCRNDVEALAEAVRQEARAKGANPSIDLDAMAKDKVTEIVTAEIVKLRAELLKAPEEPKSRQPTF